MLTETSGGLPPLDTLFAPLAGYPAVGLAVSGGADSLALLLLAHEWAQGQGPRLVVYTVDHRLRPEAAAEAAMVVREAEKLGLAARSLAWDGDKPSTGIQAAARAARYRLIGQAMARDGVPVLATAHHRHDQAETVLMRLAHGSGIDGLAGMRTEAEVEGIRIVRPLLSVDPAVLRGVVDAAGLTHAEDPSNADPAYERIRWRRALPMLTELGLAPERLATLAARAADAAEAVLGGTLVAERSLVETGASGERRFQRDLYLALPRAVRIRLLALLLDRAGGGKPRDLAPVEVLADSLANAASLPRRTLHGAMISSDGTTITITPEPGRAARHEPTRS